MLRDVGWDGYEAMLKLVGDRPAVRITYDRGDLELMSPSPEHEEFGNLLGRMIEDGDRGITDAVPGPCRSTSWRKQLKDRGLEAG